MLDVVLGIRPGTFIFWANPLPSDYVPDLTWHFLTKVRTKTNLTGQLTINNDSPCPIAAAPTGWPQHFRQRLPCLFCVLQWLPFRMHALPSPSSKMWPDLLRKDRLWTWVRIQMVAVPLTNIATIAPYLTSKYQVTHQKRQQPFSPSSERVMCTNVCVQSLENHRIPRKPRPLYYPLMEEG